MAFFFHILICRRRCIIVIIISLSLINFAVMISNANLIGAEHFMFFGVIYLLLSVTFSTPVGQRLLVKILILRIKYELCMKLQFMPGRIQSAVQYQDQCLILFIK